RRGEEHVGVSARTLPDATAEELNSAPPFKRRTMTTGRRLALTPVFWIIVWPLSKLLSRRWPLMMSRGITRMLGTFPKYEPTAADVFVCAYFKSGTNWTMHIALQIAFRGSARFEHVHDIVAWPETPLRVRMAVPVDDQRPRLASPTGLRVIKT